MIRGPTCYRRDRTGQGPRRHPDERRHVGASGGRPNAWPLPLAPARDAVRQSVRASSKSYRSATVRMPVSFGLLTLSTFCDASNWSTEMAGSSSGTSNFATSRVAG